MKEILTSYAVYNNWANAQLLNAVLKLNEEQQQSAIESSFKSIYKTFLHMLDAESIWWQRMKLQEQINVPSSSGIVNMNEVANQLLQQDKLWAEWISHASENQLQHVFAYYSSKKEYFKQPLWQAIQHIFNHATYHRGQIVTMLRQLGIEKIPCTDFAHWIRQHR
jgi:uncharacterized damage-inducible protein DinB